jgi:membrane protein insertase Oxa1/YidC/SpoIIIJ
MGDVEISSEFEYSASFLRILIPGITVTILVSFLLNLNCSQYLSFLKKSIAESVWALLPLGVTFVFVSMFIGLLIYVVINPLIRVLEGYTLELYKKKIFYKDSGYA